MFLLTAVKREKRCYMNCLMEKMFQCSKLELILAMYDKQPYDLFYIQEFQISTVYTVLYMKKSCTFLRFLSHDFHCKCITITLFVCQSKFCNFKRVTILNIYNYYLFYSV